MKSAICVLGIGTLVAAAACGKSLTGPSLSTTTTSLPPVAAPPQPVTVTGNIIVRSVTPASGSTVRVRDCGAFPTARDGNRAAHSMYICSDEPGVTVEVLVDQDISDAIVTVDFANETGACGRATTRPLTLTGGSRTVVTTSRFNMYTTTPYMEKEYITCALPTVTTQAVVGLRRPASETPLLAPVESAHQVTFTWQ
jgi:hypothetical protein